MNKPRLKKCRVCGAQFRPFNSLAKACGITCALTLGREATAKKAKAEVKKEKDIFKLNDKSYQREKAQKAFNEFIRLRDANSGCISCSKPKGWNGQWHASHWKSRGARPDLAFNEDNVHKACSICNKWLSGNVGEYRKALIEKIGAERVHALENDQFSIRYSANEYYQMAKKYREESKKLRSFQNS
jgi:hypothetical protein